MTAPHINCRGVGKFDCEQDEIVSGYANDEAMGDGDVDSPAGWWASVDLVEGLADPDYGDDKELIEHYGTPYLLIRESSQGFVSVLTFDTIEQRKEIERELVAMNREWDAPRTLTELVDEQGWEDNTILGIYRDFVAHLEQEAGFFEFALGYRSTESDQ